MKITKEKLFSIPIFAVIAYLEEMKQYESEVSLESAMLLLFGACAESYFTSQDGDSIERLIKHFNQLLISYGYDDQYEIKNKC